MMSCVGAVVCESVATSATERRLDPVDPALIN